MNAFLEFEYRLYPSEEEELLVGYAVDDLPIFKGCIDVSEIKAFYEVKDKEVCLTLKSGKEYNVMADYASFRDTVLHLKNVDLVKLR